MPLLSHALAKKRTSHHPFTYTHHPFTWRLHCKQRDFFLQNPWHLKVHFNDPFRSFPTVENTTRLLLQSTRVGAGNSWLLDCCCSCCMHRLLLQLLHALGQAAGFVYTLTFKLLRNVRRQINSQVIAHSFTFNSCAACRKIPHTLTPHTHTCLNPKP